MEDEQRILRVLYENQEIDTDSGRNISFIQKVNMGIPGGDNYVVVKNGDLVDIYVIDNDTIVAKYDKISIIDPSQKSRFDIMRDIPGTRIGSGSGSIGDYNSDGYDEIFVYLFTGMGNFISIYGYDTVQNEIVAYIRTPFDFVDPDNGPAPFEFMTYQGIDGFKMYQDIYNAPPKHRPKHKIEGKNRSWYFYAWDEGRKKFVELAEIGEDIDYTMFSNYEPEEPEWVVEPSAVIPDKPVEPEAPEPTEPVTGEEIREPEQRNIIPVIAAAAGILALAICGILLLCRKRQKRA
jgi:hypothetical protein